MDALQTHNIRLMRKIACCQKRLTLRKLKLKQLQQLIKEEEARILSTAKAFHHNNCRMILIAESNEANSWEVLHKEPPLAVDDGLKYSKLGPEQSK
jgi:hypothetical protein